jgi:hypothetical protein
MLTHPPVLALLLIASLSAVAFMWAGRFAVDLLQQWNPALGTRRQIELERRTQLVATVLAQVLALQGLALPLMVFNADRTAPLLVGAMCAFGSFNASVYGFPALYAKLALFFAAGTWLALHRTDLLACDYPLTRRKYALLLVMVPLALADAGLSLAYFIDLQPDTLTSCCGSTFHPDRPGLAAHASAVTASTGLWLLYGSLAATLIGGRLAARRAWLAQGYAVVSVAFVAVALLAVVAAVSPYVYESPHHHCPFCLLKREYAYFGFALYLPLFVGASAGLASGVLSLRSPASLQTWLPIRVQRLRQTSMAGFALFGLLCALAVWQSGLRM